MKRLFVFIVFLFARIAAFSQQIDFPVRLLDGIVEIPFVEADMRAIARKARVRSVAVVEKTDTGAKPSRIIMARYTEQGDDIHHDQWSGDNTVSDSFFYNRDGTPTLRRWREDYMDGCGRSGFVRRTPSYQTRYVYEKEGSYAPKQPLAIPRPCPKAACDRCPG